MECAFELAHTLQKTPFSQPTLSRTSDLAAFADDRYEIKEFLGEGGKKKVYRTYDNLLDREAPRRGRKRGRYVGKLKRFGIVTGSWLVSHFILTFAFGVKYDKVDDFPLGFIALIDFCVAGLAFYLTRDRPAEVAMVKEQEVKAKPNAKVAIVNATKYALVLSTGYILWPIIIHLVYGTMPSGKLMAEKLVVGIALFPILFLSLWVWGMLSKKTISATPQSVSEASRRRSKKKLKFKQLLRIEVPILATDLFWQERLLWLMDNEPKTTLELHRKDPELLKIKLNTQMKAATQAYFDLRDRNPNLTPQELEDAIRKQYICQPTLESPEWLTGNVNSLSSSQQEKILEWAMEEYEKEKNGEEEPKKKQELKKLLLETKSRFLKMSIESFVGLQNKYKFDQLNEMERNVLKEVMEVRKAEVIQYKRQQMRE